MKSISHLILIFTVLIVASCKDLVDTLDDYNLPDYTFAKVNNDSLYQQLEKKVNKNSKEIIELRLLIQDFDNAISNEVRFIDSLNSLSIWPNRKRTMLAKHFRENKVPEGFKLKYYRIFNSFAAIDSSYRLDSTDEGMRFGNKLKFQRMSFEAELERIKLEEQEVLINLINNHGSNQAK